MPNLVNDRKMLLISQREARDLLDHPERYPSLPLRHKTVLKFWRIPSFAPQHSWAIFKEPDGFYLRRVTIGRQSRELGNLNVNTYGSEVVVSEKIVKQVLSEIIELKIAPEISSTGIYLDGTDFGMEIVRGYWTCKLTWHDQAPDEWEAVGSWYERSIAFLDQHLPLSTTEYKELP